MKIKVRLDGANGPHFPFGKEAKGIIDTLQTHIDMYGENNIDIRVGSQTQLLALQIHCEKNNIELELYDSQGNKFEDITAAHKYVNDEYIILDLFGLEAWLEK